MEQLLHYCWKHKLFPLGTLQTTDGKTIEVIDPGLQNSHAGPDFFNSKIKINGTMWVGNVEIHERSSDWYAHHHDTDAKYDNVILHVVGTADREIATASGNIPPQLEIDVPQNVKQHYDELLSEDRYPPCYKITKELPRLTIHSWMSALQTERLEQKTIAINDRVRQMDGSWEAACFVTLARNYGFGVNGDAFELWAKNVPLGKVAHHRDDIFQIEAIFLGQAGLLEQDILPERYVESALNDGYFTRLRNEYLYLKHKFSLQPIDGKIWKFLRMRPQNFPYIRISQLANLYYDRRASLSQITDCETLDELKEVLMTKVTPYWETHYVFGQESKRNEKRLSAASLQLLIINTAIPLMFAYGRHLQKDTMCDRAFQLLEQLKAEDNNIVRMWQECGLPVENAADSQALIQLKTNYCDRRDCLRCRFGYEYLRRTTK